MTQIQVEGPCGEWCYGALSNSWWELLIPVATNNKTDFVVLCLSANGIACPWLLFFLGRIVMVMMPIAVESSVWIGVDGCECPISASVA